MGVKVKSFEDLIVWQKAHKLTLKVFEITSKFPAHESYSITSQLRRAAYSVPSNIVEGHSRVSQKEFKHFLSISKGSLSELHYFLILSRDLQYLIEKIFSELIIDLNEVSKILYVFTNSF